MQNNMMHTAAEYERKHRRKRRWGKVVTCLAAVVVFCTTYALILPAITMEQRLVCEVAEHTHCEYCYKQVTEITEETLVCQQAESEGHQHGEACYLPGELICTLEEGEEHRHSEDCYGPDQLICQQEESEGHIHGGDCFETISSMVDTEELTCPLEEGENHTHAALCYGTWELVCTFAEHTHGETCYETVSGQTQTEEEPAVTDEAVAQVMALIEAMPASEEIDAQLLLYEEAGDDAGYEAYFRDIGIQGQKAYQVYTALSEEQKAQVSNIDRLMDSSWLWSAVTLDTTATIPVHQVNSHTISGAGTYKGYTTLLRGKSPQSFGIDFGFAYWTSIIVEENAAGELYVAKVMNPQTNFDKDPYGPSTANGFTLLIWETDMAPAQIDVSVGDLVTVDFDYSQTGARRASGSTALSYGNVTFHTRTSNGTSTVQGASTSDFIDLNIYDYYGTKSASAAGKKDVNTNWNSDKNWPGYQWNGGAYMLSSSFSPYRVDNIDFGNSMITDYAYGGTTSGITNGVSQNYQKVGRQGGDINEIVKDSAGNWANLPLGVSHGLEVMEPNLSAAGYPQVTNAGSMVDFFSESQYAAKKNSASIDGLFQHDPVSGEYWFDSRKNHAYYSNDRFTLYNQIITPNFILYPFGNFLPFNNITTPYQITPVNEIDCVAGSSDGTVVGYMQMIRERMAANGLDTTEAQLYNMLGRYQNYLSTESQAGWKAEDSLNEYFRNSSEFGDSSINFGSDPALQAILNRLYNIDFDVEKNFLFGMDMKMNFMMPKGGMTGNDNNRDGTADYPMVFYFAGDDDVWVYIDGRLFLDLSGIHRHVGGEIDFVNGVVNYYAMDSYIDGAVSQTPYLSVGFESIVDASLLQANGTRPNDGRFTSGLGGTTAYTFKDYSTHAFNFYYMERGTGSSVCCLNFNFPLLRQNSIAVSKEISSETEILGNPDYCFQVLAANTDGSKTNELFVAADTAYSLYAADGSVIQEVILTKNPDGTIAGRRVVDAEGNAVPEKNILKTDADGVFTLKAGQQAEFVGIDENAGKYYVRELLEGTILEQYGNVTVSGESTTTSGDITIGNDSFTGKDSPVKDMSDGATAFRFINDVDETKLGTLQISKHVTGAPDITPEGTSYHIAVTLDGKKLPVGTTYAVGGEERTISEAGIITITAGETAEIDHILAGTAFTAKETAESAAGYLATYILDGKEITELATGGVDGTIKVNTAIELLINNSLNSVSVTLPVEKTLQNNSIGTVDREFTFILTPVTDATGENEAGQSLSYTLLVPAGTENVAAEEAFALSYAETEIWSFPATYYYRIEEQGAINDPSVQYDESTYLLAVTVSKNDDGTLRAEKILTKNGQAEATAAFSNTLTLYALPETGGAGTHLYTLAGLVLLCGAAYLLYRTRKRGKEAG